MTDEKPESASAKDKPPPQLRGHTYTWLIPLATVVVVVAAVVIGLSLAAEQGAPGEEPQAPEELQPPDELYDRHCGACHGTDGQGMGRFPPLAGSEWVTGGEETLILIVLHGMEGPIEVAGEEYDDVMPPLGGRLSDEEIASILTYLRSSFGHDASEIDVETVNDVRAKYPSSRDLWTEQTLQERR